MKLNKQIIVRMTAAEKQDLEDIAKDTETTVSRFIRNLINEYKTKTGNAHNETGNFL